MKRYWFDWRSSICRELIYTGYGGNENNFLTISECEKACSGKFLVFKREVFHHSCLFSAQKFVSNVCLQIMVKLSKVTLNFKIQTTAVIKLQGLVFSELFNFIGAPGSTEIPTIHVQVDTIAPNPSAAGYTQNMIRLDKFSAGKKINLTINLLEQQLFD